MAWAAHAASHSYGLPALTQQAAASIQWAVDHGSVSNPDPAEHVRAVDLTWPSLDQIYDCTASMLSSFLARRSCLSEQEIQTCFDWSQRIYGVMR